MASDSDDADFFDKLVDSDDDDRRPLPLAAAADLAEPSAGDLAALTHAADEAEAAAAHPEAPSEPVAAPAVAKSEVVHPEAPQVEAASPTSDKGAVKQAQWNDVGAASGADPLRDFSTDGADDAFFEEGAAVPMGQASQASLQAAASVVDHSFSSGVSEDANANSHLDSGAAAMESVDQSNNAQVTDTRYWESLYPGWKYDEATQQWYQIDTLSSHHNAVEVQAQPEAPHVEAASPRSDKGAVKQAQWNNFGAANGADPLGDFSMDGAEDAFFDEGAAVPRDQASQASLQAAASAVDHRFSSGVWEDANANSHLDSGAAVMESMDQSTNAQVTDPRYWESLYPGWKYDEATQQWYQIDTLSSHQNAVEVQAQPEAATTWPDSDELKPATVDPGAEAEAALPVPEPAPVHPEAVVEAHPSVPNHGSEPPESTGPSLKVEADAAPEGSSSSSCKSVQTTVKQVHWNDFGASNGADLFGDLVADGAEDAFFDGAVPGEQALQSRAALAVNHSFSTGVSDGNANSQLDNSATGTNHTQFDSADPRYWESLYPGWKYDDTTGQWYHVDTLSAQQNYSGAVVALGADSIHQREFCASYMHNYSHAALEPISEEGTTNDVNWGQDGSYAAPAEYPPSMLFYAEYPGWYFDTNTQQWQSLEVYQQTVAQTAAASDGFAGTGHSAPQTQDSHTNTYAQHSQWQPDALGNIMQPDSSADSDILGNSYGSGIKAENQFGQQADAQPLQSASKYSNTFVPSTSQYTGTDTKQASYEGLQSSVSHQNAYKGLEQSTSDSNSSMGYQSGYTGSAPYTGHQGFKPFTSKRNWSKGFGHSTGQEVAYKGFVPSTGYQTGFEPSKDHQFSHMAYEPSTNHGYGSFVPNESMYKEQTHADSVAHMHLPNNYGGTHGSGDFAQQLSVGPNGPSQQFGFSPHEQRSSAGRPPHALVTFGFGGKLIVLKETSSITANFDSRNQVLQDFSLSYIFLQ
jgi:COPII coat assembly protein SEC16